MNPSQIVLICLILYGIFSIAGLEIPKLFEDKPAPVENPANSGSNDNNNGTSNTDANKNNKVNSSVKNNSYKLSPSEKAVLMEAKQLYNKDQKLDEAYEKAVALIEGGKIPEFSTGWYEVADFLSEINTRLVFSSAPSNRKENHVVKSNDSLSSISKGHTTVIGLQLGNDIPLDSEVIHPEQVIRYFPGEWTIDVSKDNYTLVLYHKGKFFKHYKVGIGKENRTPEGRFKIVGKVTDPIWYKDGEKIQPEDPRNVLGSRWMELKPMEGTAKVGRGYGIHGTIDPESIGTPASLGCIRMRNKQIEELYDIIPDSIVVVTIRK